MVKNKNSAKKLPKHPKKHHKPFRWRHLGLFVAGLVIGVASTFRSGYFVQPAFDINAVSPATVKIYHFVCGTLMIDGQRQGDDVCDGTVGSGFLVSSDGYIATSGHVVTRDAADILVNELKNNPQLFHQYGLSRGLNAAQMFDPAVADSLLAGIYDLPNKRLKLENYREITFVALGDRPLHLNSQDDIRDLFDMPDDDYIKRAKIIDTDYSAKDLLTIEQEGQQGFSASDLALIKVSTNNAPYIKIANGRTINQNDPLSLVGFPTDAENQLTSNNKIVPTVTNGTVSSIRTANGTDDLLFQTGADASQGSSGGPAVNEFGEAFGIVTYRYKDDNQANAPKSYIRDIAEFEKMLKNNGVRLNTNSSSQLAWEKGLQLAQKNRYSAAIAQFHLAAHEYPAHRLAGTYIVQARQAIKDGKEVKDPPYGLFAALGLAVLSTSIAVWLIVRHNRQHRHYRGTHNRNRRIISPTPAS